ncbi:HPr(Ser) kinase/phosphatase [Schleiferilactobacillus perolens]|jgi:HPr kinase/phosphorylase|uniref:HPr kinase/phosphorylase n=1 Tax=Schleiferilactobacillus perolens DSM 12744 TaxID=1423792 RepID=A0A0R1MZB1_9LACO|nr:HPr(Ser) kinase/phosphatase [Schleiferilactobacillus perolens]KRL13454.1 HPr kinase phosphorylase [Schleiferilactobacillus perolens DSM 12744]MCI1892238.1 HPr(Ser) kinase/phosphatase [Schleiferilactobacillus harbinensis]MCI1912356.1 HPr(Ser) kinase/phosphatase [Schleiferilactobacillus harbinensis]MCI2170227.1 HPr(Ser) kinase/phosphatase [Schleiferilactobacillus perolens]
MANTVSVAKLVQEANLTVFSGKEFLANRTISVSDISRPGLELTGYFRYYPSNRIQLFGKTEISFSKGMTDEELSVVLRRMAQPDTPAFLVSRGYQPPAEMIQEGNRAKIPVLGSKSPTSRLSSVVTEFLEEELAERRSMHGVLVDIYGLGVLITGDSGVGKSETALDLIKRGHRLIADDRVDVYQRDEKTIVGAAPQILRHLLEIRGIGIIDVMNLFGAGAVRDSAEVSLIVHLENWSPDKNYDRIGTNEQSQQIFDVQVPKITIPVKVGRNLAIIIESAAMNFRAQSMGYDATKVFEHNLNALIKQNSDEPDAQ